MTRVLESGHYYLAKGPTVWARVGWGVLERLKSSEDKTMLLVDDVHAISDIATEERHLPNIEFTQKPDFVVMESDVRHEAGVILTILRRLPKRRMARQNGDGRWFVSGVPLTDRNGWPLCVLWDAGLTLRKRSLGFRGGVNILPFFYAEEQRRLLRIVAKAIPDFRLEVVLYDLKGNFWNMQDD